MSDDGTKPSVVGTPGESPSKALATPKQSADNAQAKRRQRPSKAPTTPKQSADNAQAKRRQRPGSTAGRRAESKHA